MNLKTNKGITLIALVITIIVLLILAGVTISMVLGDDGIITNATKAKEETEKMEYPERVRMAVASALVAGKGKGVNLDANPPVSEKSEDDNSVKNALEKEFGTEFGTVVTYTDGGTIKVKKGALNQTFTVSAKGTVTKDDEGDGSLSGEVTDEIITFYVNVNVNDINETYEYRANKGMTWAQYVDSDIAMEKTYSGSLCDFWIPNNPDAFGSGIAHDYFDSELGSPNGGGLFYNGSIDPNDLIVAGATYKNYGP